MSLGLRWSLRKAGFLARSCENKEHAVYQMGAQERDSAVVHISANFDGARVSLTADVYSSGELVIASHRKHPSGSGPWVNLPLLL